MVDLTWNRNPIPESQSSRTIPMAPPIAPPIPQSQTVEPTFQPCASTASLFLYAEGSVITCLHHDTLAIERRFHNHEEDISFISVDNVSERGAGRLVVSYDVGQTAIVWDLFTGDEISRFASFENLRVASWMRNGNVAFGNVKGDVILFEPSTSEHISVRTIFDPITALAPVSDCRTYAIGYHNGSILIASLHPKFTIQHTLTTSRGPSPIVSLAWHASSSKQKSDMLATLTSDGDLRVWSVAKPPGKEAPRVIRVLKRSDPSTAEPKWMGWSKSGKIVQYLDGETWAWDVKTKHITYEPIPAIENPRGFANYGPTATLFTLGPQNTIQQYDVENPAMVANVKHPPPGPLPPAPPEVRARTMSPRPLQSAPDIREQGTMLNGRRTPFEQNGIETARQQRADIGSPISSRSHANSVSSKASSSKYGLPFSPPSRSGQTGTSFSTTSAVSASGRETPQPSGASYAYASSVSMSSIKSSHVTSRLRNEVQFSPADQRVDLFPFARARLNDVPYKNHPPLDETNLTPDDLRRQMLSVVFGWEGDIQDLVKDELNRHPPTSQSVILLAQWLGMSDSDEMASVISSGPASLADWMLLALSQMSGESQTNKVGQALVQKLLEIGDIHTAATVLLGLGDKNDAIEVYVSQSYYMEAILMTCLVTPKDWQRQSYLVRRWGEHVVSHSQQQLAIRCFMCTGVEPSEPWASPVSRPTATFAEIISGRSPMASPEPYLNPANIPRPNSQSKPGPSNRQTAKTPALKLITSFDTKPGQKFRFPGLKSDDRTPTNVPGVTPIAESAVGDSAISPGGLGSYRLNNVQSLNNVMGSRTGTPSFSRARLPSIGETPVDVHPPAFPSNEFLKPVEYPSESEEDDNQNKDQAEDQDGATGLSLLPSARYDPNKDAYKPSPQTAVQASSDKFATIKGLPSPAAGVFEAFKERSDSRNGTKDRKPGGLQLHLDASETELIRANARSPASTLNSYASTKSPSVSGRSIDQYINSLDEASYFSRKAHGRGRRNTDETASQTSTQRHASRNTSQDTTRGRNEKRYIPPPKRSPSSPVSMSPEEIAQYNTSTGTKQPASKTQGGSRVRKSRSRQSSERRRHRSSSRNPAGRADEQRSDPVPRGRSMDRQGKSTRSPSAPLPVPQADDALRLVTSNRERLRTYQRSSSRHLDRGASVQRDVSPDGRNTRTTSRSRQPKTEQMSDEFIMNNAGQDYSEKFREPQEMEMSIEYHGAPASTTPFMGLSDRKRKELAAAELEARRLSLARNPSAPNIPFPGELQSTRSPLGSPPISMHSSHQRTHTRRASVGKPVPEYPGSSDSGSSQSSGPVRLPATPKAMRHPKYNNEYDDAASSVPGIPGNLMQLNDVRYQPDAERIGRSMSVPVLESQPSVPSDLPTHPRFIPHLPRSRSSSRTRTRGHRRESSGGYTYGPSPVTISIEETVEKSMNKKLLDPPILPELQHLNTPPPPPPLAPLGAVSPRSSGIIDIAIDNENVGRLLPRSMTAGPNNENIGKLLPRSMTAGIDNEYVGRLLPRAMTVAPVPTIDSKSSRRTSVEHRRGKSTNESFTNKVLGFTRIRSNSRGVDSWGNLPPGYERPYERVQATDGRI